nr:tyrosine-type recombinase/integrase [Candidatus Woesearchaeota archaeon]
MDLHNYKRRFDRILERLKESDISDEDKEWIHKFKDYCLCRGISYGKIDSYVFYAMKFVNMLGKHIKDATKEDIVRVMASLNQTAMTEQSKTTFKVMVKRLYKIVRGLEDSDELPAEVKWIKIGLKDNHKKLPEELLTEEEIEKIVRSADCLRDKTLLSVLAESGARCSEIGTMKIKHISFEEYGARINIHGKTGSRKILIISSTPYLQEWINQHPDNDNPEAFLWYNFNGGELLCYAQINHILKRAAQKAGIKKRVYPHLLRHSRATWMASNSVGEAVMKQYLGWTQGSRMAGIYIHMSGRDTDQAILKINGMEVENKKTKIILKPQNCIRCKTNNENSNKFCKLCGLVLDKEEADNILKEDFERQQADEIMDKLVKDPEILELIKKKLNS